MRNVYLKLFRLFFIQLPTYINCLRAGLKYDSTWKIVGKPQIIKRRWFEKLFANHQGGELIIGRHFSCNNTVSSNSIGLIQPCVFNISIDGSKIKIGDNVGISGATLNAATSITIEDNVSIGSGCLITDTDSHPIDYTSRVNNDDSKTNTFPIIIEEGAFIGARTIILKGVIIGKHSVIGAGSVVTKSIPPYSVACGNPAVIIKHLKE